MPEGLDIVGLLILFAGTAALVAFWSRGCLRHDALADGPVRATGLGAADIVMGLALWLAGQLAVGVLLLPALGAEPGPEMRRQLTLPYAYFVLLAQVTTYAPPSIYLLLRVALVWRGPHRAGLDGIRQLGLGLGDGGQLLRLTGLAVLGGVPLVAAVLSATRLLSHLMGQPAPTVAHDLLEYIATVDVLAELLALILAAVVLAAVLEEIFFRGLIQGAVVAILGPAWRWSAVIIVALAFALVHIGGVPWQALPGLLALGVILGWVYEKSGSLWPAIGLHAAFNALNIVLVRAGVVE